MWRLNEQWLPRSVEHQIEALKERQRVGDMDTFGHHGAFEDLLARTVLAYTAGEAPSVVEGRLDEAFSWFCKWHMDQPAYLAQINRELHQPVRLEASPIDLEQLEVFQQSLDLLSLAVLLGQAETVSAMADVMADHRGGDMLLEDLFAPALVVPLPQVTEFFHTSPYDPLIDAFYTAETPTEASAFVKRYLDNWYPAFSGCSWHDGHLIKKEHMSPYNGYWSFEAAAICVIHDIDDSSFRDHLVYPKDLADWARANDSVGRLRAYPEAHAADAAPRLRCQGGQPCPQAGIWHTPADPAATRAFTAGETMPELRTDYGVTIWQLGRA